MGIRLMLAERVADKLLDDAEWRGKTKQQLAVLIASMGITIWVYRAVAHIMGYGIIAVLGWWLAFTIGGGTCQ